MAIPEAYQYVFPPKPGSDGRAVELGKCGATGFGSDTAGKPERNGTANGLRSSAWVRSIPLVMSRSLTGAGTSSIDGPLYP